MARILSNNIDETNVKCKQKNRKRETLAFYLFVSPWIIGFLVFILFPMIFSFYISLCDWDILSNHYFIGIKNYIDAFHDPTVWKSLKVTFIYSIISVPLNLILSMMIGFMLHRIKKFKKLFRTMYYLPVVIGSIPVMMLWSLIFNPYNGILNQFLGLFGIPAQNWLYDTKTALFSLILMNTWGVGGGIIIWLAGFNNIPNDLYEAAAIDGASRFDVFFKITIPMLTPTIYFNLIMGVIGTLQTFSQSYVMTGGGPDESTLFFNLYIYQNAFTYFDMGYAAALAWILFVIIMFFSLLIVRSSSAWVYYENEVK